MIGLGLIVLFGIVILDTASTAAIVEVNNTSTEELPLAVHNEGMYLLYGLSIIILLIAGYFALRTFL